MELDGGMKFPIATRTDRAPSTIVEMIPGAWHLTRYFRDSHARSLTYLVSDVELIYSSRIATNLLAGREHRALRWIIHTLQLQNEFLKLLSRAIPYS